MNFKHIAISVVSAVMAIAPAQAAEFIFQYDAAPGFIQAGAPLTASLLLTTSDTVNTAGGYDILSAAGTVDGNVVLGLINNPAQPNPSGHAGFVFDNVLYTSGGAFDPYGFMVSTATAEYNFGYGVDLDNNPVDRYFAWVHNNEGYASSAGPGSLAAVPEPSAWAMVISGFGMIGGALRSRRKAAVRFG